jgi:hypothetical protein
MGQWGPLECGHVGRKSGWGVKLSIKKELRGQILIHDSGQSTAQERDWRYKIVENHLYSASICVSMHGLQITP